MTQINFFSAWFCPYAQRAWLTLAHHNIPFEYIESLVVKKDQEWGKNGYAKNPRLLQLNPKGLVPTFELDADLVEKLDESTKNMLKQHDEDDSWVLTESIDCMVFLNTVAMKHFGGTQDIMPDAVAESLLNDAAKIYNPNICSTFYRILMKLNVEEQKEAFDFFASSIADFLKEVLPNGFYQSKTPTIVDFTVIPWLLRIPVLKHFRPTFKFEDQLDDTEMQKLEEYVTRVRGLETVQKTLWKDDQELMDVYHRYANGSAKSQVGEAVKSGKNAHDV
jgi:glutathione S-transferase